MNWNTPSPPALVSSIQTTSSPAAPSLIRPASKSSNSAITSTAGNPPAPPRNTASSTASKQSLRIYPWCSKGKNDSVMPDLYFRHARPDRASFSLFGEGLHYFWEGVMHCGEGLRCFWGRLVFSPGTFPKTIVDLPQLPNYPPGFTQPFWAALLPGRPTVGAQRSKTVYFDARAPIFGCPSSTVKKGWQHMMPTFKYHRKKIILLHSGRLRHRTYNNYYN